MSSVQKILEELQNSRTLLERDKKTGENARIEYAEIEKKISSLKDQYEFCSVKLLEIYKSSAVRNMEVNLYTKKTEILVSKLDDLKEKIHLHWTKFKNLQLEYSAETERLLQDSSEFGKMWNCTEGGYEQRKLCHQESIIELSQNKNQLVHDLEHFNTMKGQVERLGNELSELEMKYQRLETSTLDKEKELFKELDHANDSLQNMLKQKENKNRQRHNELNMISKNIQECQERINKLELQTTDYQTTVEDQKKSLPMWSMPDSQFDLQQKHRKSNTMNRMFQPMSGNQIVNTQTAGINFNGKNLEQKDKEYPQSSIEDDSYKPARRVFQFKKKPVATQVTQKETHDFVSGRTLFQKK